MATTPGRELPPSGPTGRCASVAARVSPKPRGAARRAVRTPARVERAGPPGRTIRVCGGGPPVRPRPDFRRRPSESARRTARAHDSDRPRAPARAQGVGATGSRVPTATAAAAAARSESRAAPCPASPHPRPASTDSDRAARRPGPRHARRGTHGTARCTTRPWRNPRGH